MECEKTTQVGSVSKYTCTQPKCSFCVQLNGTFQYQVGHVEWRGQGGWISWRTRSRRVEERKIKMKSRYADSSSLVFCQTPTMLHHTRLLYWTAAVWWLSSSPRSAAQALVYKPKTACPGGVVWISFVAKFCREPRRTCRAAPFLSLLPDISLHFLTHLTIKCTFFSSCTRKNKFWTWSPHYFSFSWILLWWKQRCDSPHTTNFPMSGQTTVITEITKILVPSRRIE